MPETMHHLTDRIIEAGLSLPESLTLMVTRACNLNCRHCLLDCRPQTLAAPVPAPVLYRIIDEFAKLGGTHINLTGGEMLSHPHWPDILRYACRHTAMAAVCMQTNATLLTPAHIDTLLSLPLEKLTIQVSLDGASAQTHDLVREPGNFVLARQGLALLVAAGLGEKIQVAFTEMAHNMDELPQLLELVDQLGIGRLVSGTIIKAGRAARSPEVALPTPSQYRALISRYQQEAVFKECCDQKASISAIEWLKGHACTVDDPMDACDCIRNMFINAGGVLYPSVMLLHDAYAVGNAHSRSLPTLITAGLPRWRELPRIRRQRFDSLPQCGECAGRTHCAGGCMGRAHAVSGDLMQPEDRCELRKTVYYPHENNDRLPDPA